MHISIFLIFLCITVCHVMASTPDSIYLYDSFGDKGSRIYSPNKKWVVEKVEKKVSRQDALNGETRNSLVLRTRSKPIPLTLPSSIRNSYQGSVGIIWCPDNSAFVINHSKNHLEVMPFLFQTNAVQSPIDIAKLIRSQVILNTDKHVYTNRLYTDVHAVKWLGAHSLLIRATGKYFTTGKESFSPEYNLLYEWNLKSSFKLVKRGEI